MGGTNQLLTGMILQVHPYKKQVQTLLMGESQLF